MKNIFIIGILLSTISCKSLDRKIYGYWYSTKVSNTKEEAINYVKDFKFNDEFQYTIKVFKKDTFIVNHFDYSDIGELVIDNKDSLINCKFSENHTNSYKIVYIDKNIMIMKRESDGLYYSNLKMKYARKQ